jgi:hypothetical protein
LPGGHAQSRAADRLQLSCQQANKDVGCPEVNVNMAALCLVDGHAVESAVSRMQRDAAIWLLGDLYDFTDDVVVLPRRLCSPVLPRRLLLFSNLQDTTRSTRQIIRMMVVHQRFPSQYRTFVVLSSKSWPGSHMLLGLIVNHVCLSLSSNLPTSHDGIRESKHCSDELNGIVFFGYHMSISAKARGSGAHVWTDPGN